MKDHELKAQYEMALGLLFSQCRILATLPLEEMLSQLDRAETVAPFIDPTLMQQYLASPNGPIIKELLRAAIGVKAVVMKHQPTAAKETASN